MKKTNRMARGLAVILAVVVLGGVGALGARLRPYWVARYRGAQADLRGAALRYGPLSGACLAGANLKGANLFHANLTHVCLAYAELAGADLTEADLTGADLTFARNNRRTRWPTGFDPPKNGAFWAK